MMNISFALVDFHEHVLWCVLMIIVIIWFVVVVVKWLDVFMTLKSLWLWTWNSFYTCVYEHVLRWVCWKKEWVFVGNGLTEEKWCSMKWKRENVCGPIDWSLQPIDCTTLLFCRKCNFSRTNRLTVVIPQNLPYIFPVKKKLKKIKKKMKKKS
jgi:hypothetical protein